MKRYRISGPVINAKYFFLALSVIFLSAGILFIINYLVKGSDGSLGKAYTERIEELVLGALIFFIFYIGLKFKSIIEFDAKYLYVRINKVENKIELKDINKIEKPIIQWGNSSNNWVIEYCNVEGNKTSLNVNISFRKDNFAKFINHVKNLNENVVIKKY